MVGSQRRSVRHRTFVPTRSRLPCRSRATPRVRAGARPRAARRRLVDPERGRQRLDAARQRRHRAERVGRAEWKAQLLHRQDRQLERERAALESRPAADRDRSPARHDHRIRVAARPRSRRDGRAHRRGTGLGGDPPVGGREPPRDPGHDRRGAPAQRHAHDRSVADRAHALSARRGQRPVGGSLAAEPAAPADLRRAGQTARRPRGRRRLGP